MSNNNNNTNENNYIQKLQETIEKNTHNDQQDEPEVHILDENDGQLLFCEQERLDQNSPELWPETIPGVSEFTASSLFNSPPKPVLNTTMSQLKDSKLTLEDLEMLQEFGNLTLIQLMEKFHNLKNQAYQVGLEESREMTRGRYLNVLGKKK
ncbi:protein lin-52 homolog [Clytia hemisphaerica]|uniref:protein lin-52 homolog n=1 Tax=Clytia hemisphaerica TaxID=252671 RepID=UPI0034D47A8D